MVFQVLLNLSHDWLHSYAPHVLSKINRVSYGLLESSDPADIKSSEHEAGSLTRLLTAVPFLAKDVPR